MLARRLTTIFPAMTLAEAIETTRIHSVAGLTGDRTALVTTRPFHAPHHTISDAGLIGGGQVPLPGKVSLAHHAMLCLETTAGGIDPLHAPSAKRPGLPTSPRWCARMAAFA
jgi:magnesium chelatase family protein